MNLRYLFGAIVSFPLLPLMYYQGKQIRASVPKLPEAEGTEGISQTSHQTAATLDVVFVGESTIAGVGVKTHQEGFAGTFADELSRLWSVNVKWRVYARSGYTAKRMEAKLISKISEKKADLVVIGLGGNDAFRLNRPSKWKAEVHALIRSVQIKFPNAVIVFCNMPPIKEFPAFTPLIKFTVGNLVEVLGKELQQTIQQQQNVYFCSETITLKGWIDKFDMQVKMEDFFSDGVHPSKLTYQTWAKDVARRVAENDLIKKAMQ